jgi:hypothetical protein
MMQSILSLINETLTTSKAPASESTPKSGTRGDFESMLTREDESSARTSATRIKARSNSIEEHGDDVSADDESDDEDATTCVNVDDYAAWALNHTIAAPPPAMTTQHPSISMVAVKMGSYENAGRDLLKAGASKDSPAPQPLPHSLTAGETIPAAALAPKTQELAAPTKEEIAAMADDARDTIAPSTLAPNSSAITREFPIPTAAARTQELPAANAQTSALIEKMARSKNATDIPPPSGIPMVSGAPPANSNASNHVSAPQNHAPVIDLHSRMANSTNGANGNTASNSSNNGSSSSSNNGGNGNAKSDTSASDDDAMPLSTTVGSFANGAPADAAFRPTVLVNAFDLRMPTTPTRVLSTMDIQSASIEARQAAADRAVNSLTLSRAADGELDIPELGRVRVEAQTRNGEVDVRITADREETRELVSGHTHEIVIDAKSAAIPIVDLRVKHDPRAEPQTDFGSSQDSSNRRDSRRESDETTEKQAIAARGTSRARFVL